MLSPDGKLLATLANNGMFFFDSSDGRLVRVVLNREVFGAFDYNMQRLAFSLDGGTFYGVAADGTVRAWQTGSGRELWCFGAKRPGLDRQPRPVFEDDFNVGGIILLPDGSELLAKSAERVAVLKSATGEQISSWPATGYMAGVTPDGKAVYVFDEHKSAIRLLDRTTGQEIKSFDINEPLHTVCVTPDGRLLVAVDEHDAKIRVLDAATGKIVRTMESGLAADSARPQLGRAVILGDNRTLFFSGWNGEFRQYDLGTGEMKGAVHAPAARMITAVAAHPDGRTLITAGWDGLIRRWDRDPLRVQPVDGLQGHPQVAWLADGKSIITGDSSGRLDVWDAAGRHLRALRTVGPGIHRLILGHGGRSVILAQANNRLAICDLESGQTIRDWELPFKPTRTTNVAVHSLLRLPDHRAVTGVWEDGVRCWDCQTGRQLWQAPGGFKAGAAPDGSAVVAGLFQGRPQRFDGRTGRPLPLEVDDLGELEILDSVVYSPDSRTLLTVHRNSLRFRDAATGREVRRVTAPSEAVWTAAYSSDGRWLITGDLDGAVRIWETASYQEVYRLNGHAGWVLHAEFAPDQRSAVSSSADQTALIWSLRPDAVPSKTDLPALWGDLAGDPPTAYRAIWALVDRGDAAADFFAKTVAPAAPVMDPATLAQRIVELGSDNPRTRGAASKALSAAGKSIEAQLKEAMATAPNAEARQRLRDLLDRLASPDPHGDELRISRAIQALELLRSERARDVLRAWAGGQPRAALTEQAAAALARLEQR